MKHQLIMPSSIDQLRNTIIDKLMAISNKDYLIALNKLVEHSSVETFLEHPEELSEKVLKVFSKSSVKKPQQLPQHVIEGIKRGQADMKAGRSISLEEFKEKLAAK